MANTLELSGEFNTIITPSTITRILVDGEISQTINLMADTERLRIFKRVCEEASADGLVAFKDLGAEARSNVFSIRRANTTQRAEMIIYSYELDRIIFTTELELITGLSGDIQNSQEILQIAGEATAEKVIQLRNS